MTRRMKNIIAALSTIAAIAGLGCILIGWGLPAVALVVVGGAGLGIVLPRLDSDAGPSSGAP